MKILVDKIKWIDIVSPKKEDIDFLAKNYNIHPIILEELREPSQRGKVNQYDGYLYLVLHFPVWDPEKKISLPYELDVILKKDLIITARYQKNDLVESDVISKVVEKELIRKGTVELFYALCQNFFEIVIRELSHIVVKLDQLGNEIFEQKRNVKTVVKISVIKRDILNFVRIFSWLRITFSSLDEVAVKIFGKDYKVYFDDILGDNLRIEATVKGLFDTINSLEVTNSSLSQNRIDRLTRIFTIVSVITWPTLLIVSIYQMNVGLPLANSPGAFWKVCGISVIPSMFLYVYLKIKKYI